MVVFLNTLKTRKTMSTICNLWWLNKYLNLGKIWDEDAARDTLWNGRIGHKDETGEEMQLFP